MNRNPLYQGRLDALCGIYSIVNGLQIINPLGRNETEQIFIDLVGLLHKKEVLYDAMTNGLLFKDMKELIKSGIMEKYLSTISFPFVGKKNQDIADYWNTISDFLNDEQNPGAVIIGLSGKHDHWTVACSISKKSLSLQDSSFLKRLYKKNCTTAVARGQRQHILKPAQSCFLRGHKRI